jgi:tetratricopeptide (TPR) repeat protein
MKFTVLAVYALLGWSSFSAADAREDLSHFLAAHMSMAEDSCPKELSPQVAALFDAFKQAVAQRQVPGDVLHAFSKYVNVVGESTWAIQVLPEILIQAELYDDALRAIAYGEKSPKSGLVPIRWLQLKVRVFTAQKKYEEGLQATRQFAIDYKPSAIAAASEAAFLLELGREDEALKVLEEAAPRWPRYELLTEMLVSTRQLKRVASRDDLIAEVKSLTRERKFSEALIILAELEKTMGSTHRYYRILKLDVLGGMRDDFAAIELADQILATQADNVIVRMRKAIALLNQKQFNNALAELDVALKLQPNNIPVLFLHARTLRRQRNYDGALKDLDRLFTLKNGNDLQAVNLTLEVLLVSGRGKEVDKWIARVPSELLSQTLLAQADLLKEAYDSALNRLSRQPDSLTNRWLTAWGHYGKGDFLESYHILISMLTMDRASNFWPFVGIIHLETLLPNEPRPPEFERLLLTFDANRQQAMLELASHFRWTRLNID